MLLERASRFLARRALVVTLVTLPLAAYSQRRPILQLSVLSNGVIIIDGSLATMEDLDRALVKLKQQQGVVWYYSESLAKSPTAPATDAIKLVLKYELPVSLSTKDDFSDYVDHDGRPRPRPK